MSPIRDPIHGYIEITPYIEKLLDTRVVQRLRNVKQLGWTNLVYPGANHTRFEHSLGTYYLAGRMGASLSEEERREIEVAALLHDIGHGPYSHDSEETIEESTRRKHDDVLFLLEGEEIAAILDEYGIKPSAISSHIQGKTKIGQIIAGSLDVDRMDYIVRDAYYTGVAYGMVDYEHLLRNIKFYDSNIVLYYRGMKSAESLLMSRFLMYPSVYDHHVGRIAGSMFVHGLDAAISENDVNAFELQLMDDYELNYRMRHFNKYSADMVNRLNARNLFKRALYVGLDSVDKSIARYTKIHREIEGEIARMARIDEGYVLVDIPRIPEFRERNAMVLMENDQLKYLDDVSKLPKIMEESYMSDWRMGVYTLPEYREKVGKVARDFFNVERVPKQSKLEVV